MMDRNRQHMVAYNLSIENKRKLFSNICGIDHLLVTLREKDPAFSGTSTTYQQTFAV